MTIRERAPCSLPPAMGANLAIREVVSCGSIWALKTIKLSPSVNRPIPTINQMIPEIAIHVVLLKCMKVLHFL
jgi:hypothetical protein